MCRSGLAIAAAGVAYLHWATAISLPETAPPVTEIPHRDLARARHVAGWNPPFEQPEYALPSSPPSPDDAKLDFDVERDCQPERRVRAANHFQLAYEQEYARKVHDAFARLSGRVFLTVGERRSNPVFRNFVLHVQNVSVREGLRQVVVYVALDGPGFAHCQQAREAYGMTGGPEPSSPLTLACVDLSGWLPAELFSHVAERATDQTSVGAGSCAYNFIIWTKPHILATAARAATEGVLLIDTDIVVHQDLIGLAQAAVLRGEVPPVLPDDDDDERLDAVTRRRGRQDTRVIASEREARAAIVNAGGKRDIVLVTGREFKLEGRATWGVNTGVVFAAKKSEDTLHQWIDRNSIYVNHKKGDEGALQDVLFRHPAMPSKLLRLPARIVGQCGHRGSYATHYNCFVAKRTPMYQRDDWNVKADAEP